MTRAIAAAGYRGPGLQPPLLTQRPRPVSERQRGAFLLSLLFLLMIGQLTPYREASTGSAQKGRGSSFQPIGPSSLGWPHSRDEYRCPPNFLVAAGSVNFIIVLLCRLLLSWQPCSMPFEATR